MESISMFKDVYKMANLPVYHAEDARIRFRYFSLITASRRIFYFIASRIQSHGPCIMFDS